MNVSVVYGSMPVEAYRAATSQQGGHQKPGDRVPFFAAGISSVMHPHNPFAPTMHFNYRSDIACLNLSMLLPPTTSALCRFVAIEQ